MNKTLGTTGIAAIAAATSSISSTSGNSSGGGTPPDDPKDSYIKADQGLERLTGCAEEIPRAHRLLAEGVEGMKLHIAGLQGELEKKRTEAEDLKRRLVDLEAGVRKYAQPFQSSKFPWFSGDGVEEIPELASYIASSIFRGLTSAFLDDNAESTSKKATALIKAYRVLSMKNDIVGASYAINRALAAMLSPDIPSYEKRGSFNEIVRLSHLIEAGKDIDQIAIHIPNIGFGGWWIDHKYNTIVRRYLETAAEIDAREGNTLIEVKAAWLGNSLGYYLSRMLKSDRGDSTIHIDKRIDRESREFKPIKMAVGIANQLARYRKMIEKGHGERFELHITSPEPVPEDTLEALNIFFGEDKVDVIWYSGILYRNGINITRNLSGRDIIPDESLAVSAEEMADAPADEIADDTPNIEIVEEDGPGQELSEDEMEAEIAFQEAKAEASQAIYQSRTFLRSIGHNNSNLDGFIESTVRDGHWENLSALSDEELPHQLIPLYESWLSTQAAAEQRAAEADAPWQAVEDKTAQTAFNGFLANQDPRRKADMAIDWRKRVAQTIFNEHVTAALAEMQDTDVVKAEERLSNRIGEFIEYLRNRYGPRSYFKIKEDGPELLVIMKQYVWLIDSGSSSNGS